MGGIGSGSWYRWNTKPKVESCLTLDVSKLRKWGYLDQRRRHGGVTWSQDGQKYSSIGIIGGESEITLNYSMVGDGGQGESLNYTVQIVWTTCNYGGSRPWFLCPRCSRRVGVLYCQRRFLCRTCQGLVYRCQSESPLYRSLSRTIKIEDRIESLGGWNQKPKYMHWKTYRKLLAKLERADSIMNSLECSTFGSVLDSF